MQNLTHISLAVLLLLALVFLSVIGFLQKPIDLARQGTNLLAWPFVEFFERVFGFFRVVFNLKNVLAENQLLTQQVQQLTQEVARLERSELENLVLRESLGFVSDSNQKLISAEIITFDILNVSQTITLNRGQKDGIAKGDPVVASEGVLIGVVSEVFESTSQAEFVTSSDVAINAEALPSGALGIVRGEHGLGLLFDLVAQDETINPGDKIITSGLGGSFPKNLLIGQVDRIVSSEPELFQKASVVPAANLKVNRIVFVVKK